MRKMIPTDFVLTLLNILGQRCTCIKSHDQSCLIPPRVRWEFLIPVKMVENLVGYARKCDVELAAITRNHFDIIFTKLLQVKLTLFCNTI